MHGDRSEQQEHQQELRDGLLVRKVPQVGGQRPQPELHAAVRASRLAREADDAVPVVGEVARVRAHRAPGRCEPEQELGGAALDAVVGLAHGGAHALARPVLGAGQLAEERVLPSDGAQEAAPAVPVF